MAKKGPKKQKKPTKTLEKTNRFTEEDIDDEVDAFHKQRDIIPLDLNDDDEAGNSDDDMDEPVFNFEGGKDDDGSNSSESDGGDDDNALEDDYRPKGFAAKIARQAKYLKEKFGGIDDDMDDDAEDEEEEKAVWGRKKNLYYDADNVDYELQSSDEDLPKEEEAEVLKLQKEKAKFLSMEDFGLMNDDEIQSDSEGQEKTFLGAFTGKKAVAKHSTDATHEEMDDDSHDDMRKDLSGLTKEEQMEVVYSSAPELVGLQAELSDALDQLKQMEPLLPEEETGRKDISKGGVSFLEAKKILLLAYCQAISFYLLLKSEGRSVRDHPVKARLIEIKKLLEKAEEIGANHETKDIVDHNHKKKIVAVESAPSVSVPQEKHDTAEFANSAATVNVPMPLIKDSTKNFVDKNGSKKHQETKMDLQSVEMLKVRANLEAKLKQKGVFNITEPKPVKNQNGSSRPMNKRLETFDDFDDEVPNTSVSQARKQSQLPTKVKKQKLISGDDDLPQRDAIGERRKKFELRVLARTGTNPEDDDTGDEDNKGKKKRSMDAYLQENDGNESESEDEFYNQVKKQRSAKLMEKAQLYSRTPVTPSEMLEEEADGKRHISYQMEKNRGLTRARKKLIKNPRKKYKIKHQKAVIRRKGQVRDIRKPTGPYGGEASGINVNVSRSIRFKS